MVLKTYYRSAIRTVIKDVPIRVATETCANRFMLLVSLATQRKKPPQLPEKVQGHKNEIKDN